MAQDFGDDMGNALLNFVTRQTENYLRFGPVFPGEADVIHQPDEHVEVEKLLRALQITAAAMYELAKK